MKTTYRILLVLASFIFGASVFADCKPAPPVVEGPALAPLNTAETIAWVEERLANLGLYKKALLPDSQETDSAQEAQPQTDVQPVPQPAAPAETAQQGRVQVRVDASGTMVQQQSEAADQEPSAAAGEDTGHQALQVSEDAEAQDAVSLVAVEQSVPVSEALAEGIKAYQKKFGFYVTGELSDALLAHMRSNGSWPAESLFARVQLNNPKAAPPAIDKDDPSLNAHDEHGWTPLLYAVLRGSAQMTAALIKAGANVDQGSTYGTTPLILATILNKPDHLRVLLRASPRLDLTDHQGRFAEKVAFDEHRGGLSNIFFQHRKTMRQARLTKRLPFKVRMNVWDWQECYLAREGKVDVICKENPTCMDFEEHEILLCQDKGEPYVSVLADLVHRMWGGHAVIYDGRTGDTKSRLNCEEGDVMVLGIAFSE